jgi:hypothetical protein
VWQNKQWINCIQRNACSFKLRGSPTSKSPNFRNLPQQVDLELKIYPLFEIAIILCVRNNVTSGTKAFICSETALNLSKPILLVIKSIEHLFLNSVST